MIEQMKRDSWNGEFWFGMLVLILIALGLIIASYFFGEHDMRRPHEHPAADGIVTRVEIEAMVARANAVHVEQAAAIEGCHVRMDKLIDGVDAMVPGIKGRARVNELINEARRTR